MAPVQPQAEFTGRPLGERRMLRALFKPTSAVAALILTTLIAVPQLRADDDPWPGIQKDAFAARQIDETAVMVLDAPYRAEDAGVVPISIKIPAELAGNVKKLTLVIDKNPSPVVAAFTFGSGAGTAETNDGRLLMVSRFVKAAGGCAAPALKDADQALASIGKMQVKMFDADQSSGSSVAMREAQVMIRHPNYSGMQMDQLTGYYIPAKFVREIEVMRGEELVFKMEGGISLSEDPNIRFTYATGPAGGDGIDVTATDTDGKVFKGRAEPKNS